MNLARHAAVLWRFRALTVGGVVLGLVLAVMAGYQVSPSGLTARGSETWSSGSAVLVTQPGFPEGRVTLPGGTLDTPRQPSTEIGGQEYGDPNRFSLLAQLYAQLAVSDRVLDRLPHRPAAAQVEAIPVEGLAATQLPVIRLTTRADSARGAQVLNKELVQALRGLISSEQADADIPESARTKLQLLNAPAAPVKTQGRSRTASILALLLCLLGTVAVAHLLEALRRPRDPDWQEAGLAEAALVNWDQTDVSDGLVLPWSVEEEASDLPKDEPLHAGTRGSAALDPERADQPRGSGR